MPATAFAMQPYLPKSPQSFTKVDVDANGKVTAAELTPRVEKGFDRMDVDRNGAVSTAEINDSLQKALERRRHVLLQVQTENLPAHLGERFRVTNGLGPAELAQGVGLPGNLQVPGRFGAQHDRHDSGGAALVELARRVQETRAVAHSHRAARLVDQLLTLARLDTAPATAPGAVDLARLATEHTLGRIGLGLLEIDERREQTEQRGEVVGLGRRLEAEREPEPRDARARLTAEHALLAEVDRRVRVDVEEERRRLVHRVARFLDAEGARDACVFGAGRFAERADAPQEIGAGHQRSPIRKTSRAGLSGRMNQ